MYAAMLRFKLDILVKISKDVILYIMLIDIIYNVCYNIVKQSRV